MGRVASVNSNLVYGHLVHASIDPPTHLRLTALAATITVLSQQQAPTLLGYTQVSWDNNSGKEAQPASASKKWIDLTAQEMSSATVLGYTEQTWSTISVTRKALWSDLTVTAGEDVCYNVFVLVD